MTIATPPGSEHHRRRSLPLGSWLMAAVLLAVVLAVLGCTVLIENFARRHAETEATQALTQIASDFRDALDRGMAQQFQQIRVMASLEQFRHFDHPEIVRRALDEAHAGFDHFAWMGLTDDKGKVLASAGGLLEGQNVSQRPWWQGAQKGVFVGDVHGALLLERLLPKQDEPWRFVDFAVPIRDEHGALQGVFGAHLSWAWAREIKSQLIDTAMQVHGAEAMVIGRDGNVLLGPPGSEGRPLPGLTQAMLTTPGVSHRMTANGQSYFVVTAATRGQGSYPGSGWIVMLRKPATLALADYFELRKQITLIALLLLVLSVPLAWLLARKLSAPLVSLAQAISMRHHLGEAYGMPRVRGFREAELLSEALAELSERQAEQDALLERRVTERTSELQHAMERLEASERRLEQLSRIDTLTGYPNRRQFDERLPQAMARCRRNGTVMGLLFLDVDKFKHINDSLGHAAGDAVLKEFARRLGGCVRETDTVARLGGDEFVLIVEGAQTTQEPERIAGKVLDTMRRPFEIDGKPLTVSTSVGVACYRGEDWTGDQLMARADAALYAAKDAGRGAYRVAAT